MKDHYHIRPSYTTHDWVIDRYDGKGQWRSCIVGLDYREALLKIRRLRYRQKRRVK